jgi:Flp pilus assembly protein TadD
MPETTIDTPPSSAGRLRWLLAPFRRVGRWFAHQPRTLQIWLAVVLVAGLATAGIFGRLYLAERATSREVTAAWHDFDDAARKTDLDEMRTALGSVLAASPNDSTATRYRDILDRGEADPDTPELARVLLAHFIRTDQLPEAAREAEKVLAKYPKHWQAHCSLAHFALQVRHDPGLAERQLGQLPDPADPDAMIDIGGLLYALRLSELVGHDTGALHRIIVQRLAPSIRTPSATNASPAAKAQIVSCYLEPFRDPASLGELASYWAAADRLVDDAVNEAIAAGDIAVLAQLAALGPRMRSALVALRNHDPNRLPDDRVLPLLKAIDDRTRRAWQTVREKEPDRPDAYKGLAILSLTENDVAGAQRQIEDGLLACGDRAELLELLANVVAQHGSREKILEVADRVWDAAVKAQNDAGKWCLAAEIALVVSRLGFHHDDYALAACQKAREIAPNHPWACVTESELWIARENFLKARESLAALGEPAIFTNPRAVRLHARILVGSGLWVLINDEYKKVADAQARLKTRTSVLAVAFLFGVLEAPPNAERAAWVAAKAELVLAADPEARGAAFLRADSLCRLADLSAVANPKGAALPPQWNADRVSAALHALDQLPPDERANPGVNAAVAALQLKGQGNAAAAMRTIAPLLQIESALGGQHLEILGAVLAANDRPADAVRVLERAARFPRPSAGGLVALALAYHQSKQPLEARRALAAAESMPNRTEREQAELIAAKLLFQRENP